MKSRQVKSIAGKILTGLGLHSRLVGDRGVVVAFHRVSDAYQDSLTVPVKTFETFCRFFQANFIVVSLSDIVGRLERGESLSRTLAVTFDDGYRDNYDHAAPILSSLGLPATFFVVSDFLDTDRVATWDRGHQHPPSWMTWHQVRQLHERGFEIGAHTRTHVNLGQVTGELAESEISGSRREIEARLGGRVELFAHPFGGAESITEANRQLVRQAGFRCCASCFGGSNPRGGDPFRLRRIPISSWFSTPGQFAFETALRRD